MNGRKLWFVERPDVSTNFASCHPISHLFIGRVTWVMTPRRSPAGGRMILWTLRFAINRLTIADFRDVRVLGV